MADATDQAPKDLIGLLDFYLVKKAPFQLPEGFKEFLVKFGPWITLVLMIFTLPFLLFALGFSAVTAPFMAISGSMFLPAMIVICIAFVMRGIALPGLFARKMSGWKMLFYAQLASLLASLLMGSIIGFLVGATISLYLLFQIRPLYKE